MNERIIEFYENVGPGNGAFSIGKMIKAGSAKGYRKEQVQAAAEKVYQRWVTGEKIKPINIARAVFGECKGADASKYNEENRILKEHKSIMGGLEDTIDVWKESAELMKKAHKSEQHRLSMCAAFLAIISFVLGYIL